MSMFQKSVLNKYLNNLKQDEVEKAFQKFSSIFIPEKIENIKNSKEEEYQDGFLVDLFVNIMGYIKSPDPGFNLKREYKNKGNAKKADGAIIKDGKAIAVIELKSTKTKDLESITSQAFGYKNSQPDCRYVITSNFHKLRFYIENKTEYEEFDLFNLNEENFERLYLVLSKDNLLNDIPLALKKESIFHEEEISKKLYQDYSIFKNKLFENLIKNNKKHNKLILFKKTQKLIDRFLFILFAEDKGLLPPNSINRIIERFESLVELDAYKPIYDIYKQYFGYMNTGRPGKVTMDDIPAYNGGLFYPDEILDNLKIDDKVLIDDLKHLSSYDFATEVDVNILGHIFEHSLSEIEEITAEIEGTTPDKSKSKRKKDGVFYTPKYITQYIVEHTIGALCTEKREELELLNFEVDKSCLTKKGLSKKGKLLDQKLEDYKHWLLSLKILDPACGSGAFLNQALDFLIKEHEFISESQNELHGGSGAISFMDIDVAVLENNIFGVDINEESVEIARLSLWLRTARKGRKLSVLSNNVKCGNSLIDDPKVAGDKAFKWEKEFPEIMENGGFDVVIGNPPYVPTEYINDEDKQYLEKVYKSAFGRINLYPVFYEKGIKVLKKKRLLGFITPYTILKNQYYKESRRFILENTSITGIVDFNGIVVFEDAAVDSIIFLLKKEINQSNSYRQIYNIKSFQEMTFDSIEVEQVELMKNEDLSLFLSPNDKLIRKVSKNTVPLEDIINFNQGIITGNNKKFLTEEQNSLTKKIISGRDFNRYSLGDPTKYIIYDTEKLHRPRSKEIFEVDEKILLRQTGAYPICAIDKSKYYTLDTVHNGLLINESYDLKFLLSMLNSKLLRFLYENAINESGKVFAQVKIIYINPLPIKKVKKTDQKAFVEYADKMLRLNSEFQQKKQKFLNRTKDNLNIKKLSKKLDSFYGYEFKTFVEELKKQKIKLSLNQQDEWEEYFINYKNEIKILKTEINLTDQKIDQMVYELYGLTKEEIEIVEAG